MSKNVLIVEDDPAIGQLLTQILKLEGYTSTLVVEGRNAIQALRAGTYDLAILDVMLPGMDGIAILKAIRDETSTSELPVIMLTAKRDDETTWAGWRAGCYYFMTKPFEPEDLIAALKTIEPARSGA